MDSEPVHYASGFFEGGGCQRGIVKLISRSRDKSQTKASRGRGLQKGRFIFMRPLAKWK